MPPQGSAEWKKLNRELKILRAKQTSAGRLMPKDAQRLAWLEERLGEAEGVKRIRIKEEDAQGPTIKTSEDHWATEMDEKLAKEAEEYELRKAWEKEQRQRPQRVNEIRDSRRGRQTFQQKELSNFAVDLTEDLKQEGFQEVQQEEEEAAQKIEFGRRVSYAKDESERLIKRKRGRESGSSNPFAIDLADGLSNALEQFEDFSTVADTAAKSHSAEYDDELDELPDPRLAQGGLTREIEQLYEADVADDESAGRSLGELTSHEVDEGTIELNIDDSLVRDAVDYANKEGLVGEEDGRWAVDERGRDIRDREEKARLDDERFEYTASDVPSSLSVSEVEEEDLQEGFGTDAFAQDSTQEVSDLAVLVPDPPPDSDALAVLVPDPPSGGADDLPDMSDDFDVDLPEPEPDPAKPPPSKAPPTEYEHKEEYIEAPDLSGEDGPYSAPDLGEDPDIDSRSSEPLRLGFKPDATRMDLMEDEPGAAPDLSDMISPVDDGGMNEAEISALSAVLDEAAGSIPEDAADEHSLEFKLEEASGIDLEVELPDRSKAGSDTRIEATQQSDEMDSFWGLVDEMEAEQEEGGEGRPEATVAEEAPASPLPAAGSSKRSPPPLPALGLAQASAPKPAKVSPSFDDLQPVKERKPISLVSDDDGGLLDNLFGGDGAAKPAAPKPTRASAGGLSGGAGLRKPAGAVMPNELSGERKATVHFKDGVNRRGVIHEIDTNADLIHLAPAMGDGPGEDLVALALKAIFLMLPRGMLPPEKTGYTVRLRMMDGRDLSGYTPDYDPQRKAFTLFPEDDRGNIERVIVYNDAIKNIWFEQE